MGMNIKQFIITILLCVFATGCKNKVDLQICGRLELDRIAVQAQVAEEISEITVPQGSRVKKGQIILRLQDKTQQELVAIAKAEVSKTKARLMQLLKGAREEDISVAIAKLELEKVKLLHYTKEVDRKAILIEKNALQISDFDESIAVRDSLKSNLKVAQEKLNKLKNGTTYEEIIQAEATYEQACSKLAIEQNKLKNYTIRATCNGRLEFLLAHCGKRVEVGKTVAVILADGNLYARIYLPEAIRHKITIGSNLKIAIGQAETTYSGVVRSLAMDSSFISACTLNQKECNNLVYIAEIELTDYTNLSIGLPVKLILP